MLKQPNMRNELKQYLSSTIGLYEQLQRNSTDGTRFKDAWYKHMFAINFVLEDIDVLGKNPSCIGVLLYDSAEDFAIQEVGRRYYDFYQERIGKDFEAAFRSYQWTEAVVAAKSALSLLLHNDALHSR
jgi:hypothetical protein